MKRPNFLVFMTDHQRGDIQPPFGRAITPNMDLLFSNGITFTDAYCPSPHCCPSRATFFSGLYPSEHGVWNNVDASNTLSYGLYDNVRLFSEDLKDSGYNMYFSGKWHISHEVGPDQYGFELIHHTAQYKKHENLPSSRGWNVYSRVPTDDLDSKKDEEGRIVRPGYKRYVQYGVSETPYRDIDVVDAAVEKLKTIDDSEPFFMFVGPLGPHDPYKAPQRCLDMYNIDDIKLPENFDDPMTDKPNLYRRTANRYAQLTPEEHRESLRHYLAFCTYEDELFGMLLDTLKERDLLDNTYVIFLSDHGDYAGEHGLWSKGLPCFRGAYHICSTIGFGGLKERCRTDSHLVSLADWAPTILELAGVTPKQPMSGRSLAPLIQNAPDPAWRDTMFTQTNGNEIYGIQRGVFDNKWKYVFNAFDFDELYDLENDPHELHNLAEDPKYADILREMCLKMWRFAKEHSDRSVGSYIMTAMAPYGPGLVINDEKKSGF